MDGHTEVMFSLKLIVERRDRMWTGFSRFRKRWMETSFEKKKIMKFFVS